jgi:hypothetical protein
MKISRLIVAAAAIVFVLPAHPARPAVTDPVVSLYFYPGVRDNGGGAGTGVATSIHCVNFSGATEKLQYVVFNFDSSIKANLNLNIGQDQTRTASTHDTVLYAEDLILNTGVVNQGSAIVGATSVDIVCTAQVLDAAAATPNGIDLHGLRFNAVPSTAE